jgi:nucleoside-diphosphate-sugar epimerase
MRILVLGGTAWLGSELVRQAVDRGHEVTSLARGESGASPAGARFVRADRDRLDAFRDLDGQQWDVVIDVTRQPGQAKRAVEHLGSHSGHWVYVSSSSAYADTATPGVDEGGALLAPLEDEVLRDPEDYGRAKVACERHVLEAIRPDHSLIARVGLIGGPGDLFGRTGYWPLRFARPADHAGRVLVPSIPGLGVQVIDVRDLASWLLDASEHTISGIFNVGGPTLSLEEHLAVARRVAGHEGELVEASEDWLVAHGVEPWMGPRSLPLWLETPAWAGLNSHDTGRAVALGLVARPLEQTLADVLAWELEQGADRPRRAGLTSGEERLLLEAFDGVR